MELSYKSKVYAYSPIKNNSLGNVEDYNRYDRYNENFTENSEFDWENKFNNNNEKLKALSEHYSSFPSNLSKSLNIKQDHNLSLLNSNTLPHKLKYKLKDGYGRVIKTGITSDSNNVISNNDYNDDIEVNDNKFDNNIIPNKSVSLPAINSIDNFNINRTNSYNNPYINTPLLFNSNIKSPYMPVSYNNNIYSKNNFNSINSMNSYNMTKSTNDATLNKNHLLNSVKTPSIIKLNELNNNFPTNNTYNSNYINSPYINNQTPNSTLSKSQSPGIITINNSYKSHQLDSNLKSKFSSLLKNNLLNQITQKEEEKKKRKVDNEIEDLKLEIKTLKDQNELDEKYLNKLSRTDERYNIFFDRMFLNIERLKRYRQWLNNLQKNRKKDYALYDDNVENMVTKIRSKVGDHNYNVCRNIIHIRNEERNANYFVNELKKNLGSIRNEFKLKQANLAAEKEFIYNSYGDLQYKMLQGLEKESNSKKAVFDTSSLDDFYKKFENMDTIMKGVKFKNQMMELNKEGIIVDTRIHDPEMFYYFNEEKKNEDGVYSYNKKNKINLTEDQLREKINKSLNFYDRYKKYGDDSKTTKNNNRYNSDD